MYKYFISFSCETKSGNGIVFGNTVVETNVKVTDFDSVDDMQRWITDAQKCVQELIQKKNSQIKINSVIILNFQLLS